MQLAAPAVFRDNVFMLHSRHITLKVRRIGHSLGLILPHELAAALNIAVGDTLQASVRPSGLWLALVDPGFDRVLAEFECSRRQMRRTLRVLADMTKDDPRPAVIYEDQPD